MLTLTNALTIDGFTVFHDDANEVEGKLAWIDELLKRNRLSPLADPAATGGESPPPLIAPRHRELAPARKRFYVLPDTPVIARDDQGKPIFSLIVYRRDEERIDPARAAEDVGGGILTFTVELAIPKQKFDRVRDQLRRLVYGSDFDAADPNTEVELAYVPFLEGKVGVAVAGETGAESDHEFVKTVVGSGKVSGVGGQRRAVMVKLTQDGASLMSQIDRLNTLPINVNYELTFEHRLLGVNMRVFMDVTQSYHLLQETQDASYDPGDCSDEVRQRKINKVTETLTSSKTMGVVITPYTSEIDDEVLSNLEKYGMDMLQKQMQTLVETKPPPPEIDRTYLDKYFSDVNQQFNFSLDRRMVLQRSHTPSANIASVFRPPARLDELIAYVDLRTGFFSFLKIPIRVNADFSKLPLDSVTVTVTYHRERFGGGGREERVDSFNFTDGAAIQTFLAYANSLADVAYDWSATVFYKGSQETFTIERRRVKENFLVIPVGQLGMLQVEVGAGLVDFDKFPRMSIALRYRSRAAGRTFAQEFVVDKEKQTALWTEVILEDWNGEFEYKADWLRKSDGAILEGEWTRGSGSRLRIDAPVPDHFDVSVVCTGNFKEEPGPLVQVAVSLDYADEGHDHHDEKQFTFTDDKQMQTWTVDLRDPDLRRYRYKWTNVYKGGLVRQFPKEGWYEGEPGFITVGERYLFEVNLFPVLLKYPDNAAVVQVDLTYVDEAQNLRQVNSFVFSKEQSKAITWRVRGEQGAHKRYSVDVQYISATGQAVKRPTEVRESEAFVIPPLVTP